MKQLLTAVACSLALAACATAPTVYAPATGPTASGFTEYRIEPGRYRVTYRGGAGAPPAQVADYALLRAAELALSDGYDWFRVADRWMEGSPDRGPQISVGGGSASFGRRSSIGVGLGTSFSLGGGPRLAQTIEVVMGRGALPRDADAYDAREIQREVGGRLGRAPV
ncbi:MAG: hypothetical protein IT546_15795 [Caulobacteraceae bacterium]|nr:hypothetical protein [Caulobacteraceae bacterium]